MICLIIQICKQIICLKANFIQLCQKQFCYEFEGQLQNNFYFRYNYIIKGKIKSKLTVGFLQQDLIVQQQQQTGQDKQEILSINKMSLKQGLKYLIQKAQSKSVNTRFDQKTVVIPIYSFINQLLSSLKAFINSHQFQYWDCYLVDQYAHQRSLSNIIRSWQKLKQTSLQCNLLQTFLHLANKNKIKLYLKARKFIVQTSSNIEMIDEVLLNLQDTISIIYKLFQSQQVRKLVVQGIKNIFVAFKMSQAKIYSTVFIEYLLSIYDAVFKLQTQEATISGQFNTYKSNKNNSAQFYSSISNFQSSIHEDNGLYKKTMFSQANHKKYQIIDRKFLPMQQTSQFVSSEDRNKNMFNSHYKHSISQQRSSFFQFISKPDGYQHEFNIQKDQSDTQRVNSFYKSNYKQRHNQSSQLVDYDKKRFRNQSPTTDKNKNVIQNQYKLKQKKYQILHPAKFTKINKDQQSLSGNTFQISQHRDSINRDSNFVKRKSDNTNQADIINKESPIRQTKNQGSSIFSLNNFSKKLFGQSVSQERERQSLLKKFKEEKKRQFIQRRQLTTHNNEIKKQPDINFNSTDQLQIQNQLIKRPQGTSQASNQVVQTKNLPTQNLDKKSESFKKANKQQLEQFQKLIQKNQQFKQKMLKKNYSSSDVNTISQNQQDAVKQAININVSNNLTKIKITHNSRNSKNQQPKSHSKSKVQKNDKSLMKLNLRQEGQLQKKRRIGQRLNDLQNIRKHDEKLLQSLNNVYKTRKQYKTHQNNFQSQNEHIYSEERSLNHKYSEDRSASHKYSQDRSMSHKYSQDRSVSHKQSSEIAQQFSRIKSTQMQFQPQIIHKSIGQRKKIQQSKDYYHQQQPKELKQNYIKSNIGIYQRSNSRKRSQHLPQLGNQNSGQNKKIQKMKEMIKIIDDYSNGYDSQKASISESNYKRSNFYDKNSYKPVLSANKNQQTFFDI